jgi:UDP-N-acetylmuramyl pentapeptide phosphotransferase/UDP-N-acetylglucosamine-1-phosphate transferase
VHSTRVIIAILVVVAVLIVVFATGWADDRAKPGSRGRAPVSTAAP